MDKLNWIVILSTSVIPLLVGIVYYNPKVLGTAWMKAAGVTPESGKNLNMPRIFALCLVFGAFLAVFFMPVVLHFMHAFSLAMPVGGGDFDVTSPGYIDALAFTDKYSGSFRSFGHGALHATMAALLCAWPVLGIAAMFENRGWKYVAIHMGYYVITFALMGGIICAYGVK